MRTTFYKEGYNLLDKEERLFFDNIFSLAFYCAIGKFQNIDDYPDIKKDLQRYNLQEVRIVLNSIFSSLVEVSPFPSVIMSIEHETFDELFQDFNEHSQKLHNVVGGKFWQSHIIKFNGGILGNFGTNPNKNKIISTLKPEDFYNLLIVDKCFYNTKFTAFYKTIIQSYPADNKIFKYYTSHDFSQHFNNISSIKDWAYHWGCFNLRPSQESADNIIKILNSLKNTNDTMWLNFTDQLQKWEDKNNSGLFSKLAKAEVVNNVNDIIFDTLKSQTILIDVLNVQNFIKNNFNEKNHRYPSSIIERISGTLNNAINPETTLFRHFINHKLIKIDNFEYMAFTFHHNNKEISEEHIEHFYKKCIMLILKNKELSVSPQEFHILEHEHILECSIPEAIKQQSHQSLKSKF